MVPHKHPINTAGAGSESQEQQSLFAWWFWSASRWPDAVMFAIPNGGWRSLRIATRLKAEGVLAGVPDEEVEVDTTFGARWLLDY